MQVTLNKTTVNEFCETTAPQRLVVKCRILSTRKLRESASKGRSGRFSIILMVFLLLSTAMDVLAWYDETHVAIAKAAGYSKWFNAAAADVARMKIGDRELQNHYVNNPRGTVVTAEMVIEQTSRHKPLNRLGTFMVR